MWVVIGMYMILIAGMVVRVGNEEKALKEYFGREWEVYCKRVPWRMVPGVI